MEPAHHTPPARQPAAAAAGIAIVLAASIAWTACDRSAPAPAAPPKPVSPVAVDAALDAADEYLTQNDLASAATVLEALTVKAPRDFRAHERYALVLFRQASAAQAVGDVEAAQALSERAYESYRRAVDAAGESDPALAAGLNQSAGELASLAGRRAEALEHFRTAGRLDPDNPRPPLYEAQMLLALSRHAEAEAPLRRVLMLDPDESFAHASLAEVAVAAGNCEIAFEHMRAARDIVPGDLALRIQEARVRRRCGDPRGALQGLVALAPETRAEAAVASEMAACYTSMREPGRAAQVWEHRLAMHPEAWPAAVSAAEARLEAGDRERALALWQHAFTVAPDEPAVAGLRERIGAQPPSE